MGICEIAKPGIKTNEKIFDLLFQLIYKVDGNFAMNGNSTETIIFKEPKLSTQVRIFLDFIFKNNL